MCTAPSSKVIETLLPGLAIGGQLLILALPAEPASVNLGMCHSLSVFPHRSDSALAGALIMSRSSIRGWPSGVASDSEDALDFYKKQGVKCMVQTFPLDKAQEAYEHRDKARFRAVIVPEW
jgi:D-arabinose 1-dehydrogenase-like Zn-dependent alcohol dehydrogenase